MKVFARFPVLSISIGYTLIADGAGCLFPYSQSASLPIGRSCPDRSDRTITWLFPTETSDNHQLEDWCATVGPPAVEPTPTTDFGQADATDSIAIVTWNTDAGAGHVLSFLQAELGLKCSETQPHLSPGSTHFVLLLQEAFRRTNGIPDVPDSWAIQPAVAEETRPGPRLDITEIAERCGLALYYVPGARNGHAQRDGKREDKGEAILSTLPMTDFLAIELPYEAARRVAVGAIVHSPGGAAVRVMSVHLISMTPIWRIFQTGNSSRQRQALAVVEALRAADQSRPVFPPSAGPESFSCCQTDGEPPRFLPTVVAGDLNTWSRRETALRHLLEQFPDSPPLLKEPTRGPFPTDHILFRGNGRTPGVRLLHATYRRIDDTYYSDHNPVVAWISFGRF